MNSPSFSVYSKIGCPFCTKIMSLLEMSEIYYTEYKLGRDFTKEEFYSKFGTGSTFIYGYFWFVNNEGEKRLQNEYK